VRVFADILDSWKLKTWFDMCDCIEDSKILHMQPPLVCT
jgi:hypothetical protein